MGLLKKFNEYFYPSTSKEDNEMDSDMEMDTKDSMGELEKLESGEVNQIEMNGFIISKPSELDGEYLIDKGGKHMRKSSVEEVMDVVSGKSVFESKRHRRNK